MATTNTKQELTKLRALADKAIASIDGNRGQYVETIEQLQVSINNITKRELAFKNKQLKPVQTISISHFITGQILIAVKRVDGLLDKVINAKMKNLSSPKRLDEVESALQKLPEMIQSVARQQAPKLKKIKSPSKGGNQTKTKPQPAKAAAKTAANKTTKKKTTKKRVTKKPAAIKAVASA